MIGVEPQRLVEAGERLGVEARLPGGQAVHVMAPRVVGVLAAIAVEELGRLAIAPLGGTRPRRRHRTRGRRWPGPRACQTSVFDSATEAGTTGPEASAVLEGRALSRQAKASGTRSKAAIVCCVRWANMNPPRVGALRRRVMDTHSEGQSGGQGDTWSGRIDMWSYDRCLGVHRRGATVGVCPVGHHRQPGVVSTRTRRLVAEGRAGA